MPIETFDFINSLVAANPLHTEGLDEADSHLRGTKQTLLNSFPNIAGAVSATDVELSAAGSAFTNPGVLEVAPNGTAASAGLLLDSITPGSNVRIVNTGSDSGAPALSLQFTQSGTTTNAGTLTAAGLLTLLAGVNAPSVKKGGNELLPSGIICMWSGATTAVPAGWSLCDGTNGTPNLLDKFIVGAGDTYAVGATAGSSTVNLTTSQDGAHQHGGLTGAGGSFSTNFVTDVQGSHNHGANTAPYTLTINDVPYHDHGVSGGDVVVASGGSIPFASGSFGGSGEVTFGGQGGGGSHWHDIYIDGAHQHNVTVSTGGFQLSIGIDGAHTHSVNGSALPPYYALAFIMKL